MRGQSAVEDGEAADQARIDAYLRALQVKYPQIDGNEAVVLDANGLRENLLNELIEKEKESNRLASARDEDKGMLASMQRKRQQDKIIEKLQKDINNLHIENKSIKMMLNFKSIKAKNDEIRKLNACSGGWMEDNDDDDSELSDYPMKIENLSCTNSEDSWDQSCESLKMRSVAHQTFEVTDTTPMARHDINFFSSQIEQDNTPPGSNKIYSPQSSLREEPFVERAPISTKKDKTTNIAFTVRNAPYVAPICDDSMDEENELFSNCIHFLSSSELMSSIGNVEVNSVKFENSMTKDIHGTQGTPKEICGDVMERQDPALLKEQSDSVSNEDVDKFESEISSPKEEGAGNDVPQELRSEKNKRRATEVTFKLIAIQKEAKMAAMTKEERVSEHVKRFKDVCVHTQQSRQLERERVLAYKKAELEKMKMKIASAKIHVDKTVGLLEARFLQSEFLRQQRLKQLNERTKNVSFITVAKEGIFLDASEYVYSLLQQCFNFVSKERSRENILEIPRENNISEKNTSKSKHVYKEDESYPKFLLALRESTKILVPAQSSPFKNCYRVQTSDNDHFHIRPDEAAYCTPRISQPPYPILNPLQNIKISAHLQESLHSSHIILHFPLVECHDPCNLQYYIVISEVKDSDNGLCIGDGSVEWLDQLSDDNDDESCGSFTLFENLNCDDRDKAHSSLVESSYAEDDITQQSPNVVYEESLASYENPTVYTVENKSAGTFNLGGNGDISPSGFNSQSDLQQYKGPHDYEGPGVFEAEGIYEDDEESLYDEDNFFNEELHDATASIVSNITFDTATMHQEDCWEDKFEGEYGTILNEAERERSSYLTGLEMSTTDISMKGSVFFERSDVMDLYSMDESYVDDDMSQKKGNEINFLLTNSILSVAREDDKQFRIRNRAKIKKLKALDEGSVIDNSIAAKLSKKTGKKNYFDSNKWIRGSACRKYNLRYAGGTDSSPAVPSLMFLKENGDQDGSVNFADDIDVTPDWNMFL